MKLSGIFSGLWEGFRFYRKRNPALSVRFTTLSGRSDHAYPDVEQFVPLLYLLRAARESGNLGVLWERFRFLQKRNLALSVRFRPRSGRSDLTDRVSASDSKQTLAIDRRRSPFGRLLTFAAGTEGPRREPFLCNVGFR